MGVQQMLLEMQIRRGMSQLEADRHKREQALHPIPILWAGKWEQVQLKEPEVVVETFSQGPYR